MSPRKLQIDSQIVYTQPDFKLFFENELHPNKWCSYEKLNLEIYPSVYTLAVFASTAYTIDKPDARDIDVEQALRLPKNWKLLTRCYNKKNHYQGVAFWNPISAQVVVAHAGTDISKHGTLKTDWQCVIKNEYNDYMNSAVTFANRIFVAIEQFAKATGIILQLSFTGHSLGGWLAQITTFTTEYLICQSEIFTRSPHVKYHNHAVAFDSPGCESFLLKLQKDYNLRCVKSDTHYTDLDITIYLSAPNLVNTWDFHVGSVYRIFPCLLNISSIQERFMYTLKAHNMDSILRCFNEETGKPYEVREVLDWLNRKTLLVPGHEYHMFFIEGKRMNNFHVETNSEELRYKTKQSDFSQISTRIFSNSERIFLETLRKHKEDNIKLVKLTELKCLFNLSGDETLFPDFELKENVVKCESSDLIELLIKQIKNVFRWCPDQIRAASQNSNIARSLCEMESRRYLNLMQNTELQFTNSVFSSLIHTNDNRVLVIFSVDLTHDSVVLAQMCFAEKAMFLNWEQITELTKYLDVIKVLESHCDILFVECNQINDNGEFLKELLNCSIRKIILLTHYEQNRKILKHLNERCLIFIHRILKNDLTISLNNFECIEFDNFDFSCLTSDSQRKIVEQAASDSQLYKPTDEYYVKRNLIYNNVIRKDIWRLFFSEHNSNENLFVFTNVDEKDDLITLLDVPAKESNKFLSCDNIVLCSESAAQQKLNAESKISVHWLNVAEKQLKWNGSSRSMEILQKYVDYNSTKIISEDDIDEWKNYPSKIVVIADEPGMGKTTTLYSLANKFRDLWNKNSPPWVIVLSLNSIQTLFSELSEQLDLETLAEFLLNASTTTKNQNEVKTKILINLLKNSLLRATPKEIIIMLDGFDEIKDGSIQDKVVAVVLFLKQKTLARVFITTRKHFKLNLENSLSVFTWSVQKISKNQQKEFFKAFFKNRLKEQNFDNIDVNKLEEYVVQLYETAQMIFNDEIVNFIGVPLQMRMLAEVMLPDKSFFNVSLTDYLNRKLGVKNVYDLYERFVEAKLLIYYKKADFELTSVAQKWLSEKITALHRIVGIQQVFPEIGSKILEEKATLSEEDGDELNRVGLVQYSNSFELEFTHYTFAEYYTAKLLLKWLQKTGKERHEKYDNFEEFLLTKVLLESRYKVIRFFLNNCLKQVSPITLSYKNVKNLRHFKFFANNGWSAFHRTAEEGNENIAKFLLTVEELDHDENVVEFLTKHDRKGRTAVFLALTLKHYEWLKIFMKVLESCSERVKEKIIFATLCSSHVSLKSVISNKLQDTFERVCTKIEALEELYKLLFKMRFKRDEVEDFLKNFDDSTKIQLLNCRTGKYLKTHLHIAAQIGDVYAVEYLLEHNCDPHIGDIEGNLPIHDAAQAGHLVVVERFHRFGVSLDAQNNYYMSVVACAAANGHLNIVRFLVDNGADFEKPDRNSISPFMHATKHGHASVVEDLAARNIDVNKSNKFGTTALGYAARAGYLKIVKFLVLQKNANVNCTDQISRTPLIFAIRSAKWKVVDFLLTRPEIHLNVITFSNMTTLDHADRVGKSDVIKKLTEMGAKRFKELRVTQTGILILRCFFLRYYLHCIFFIAD